MKHGPLGVAMVTDMDNQRGGSGPQSVKNPHEDTGVCVGREGDDDITILGRDRVVENMAGCHKSAGGYQFLTKQSQGYVKRKQRQVIKQACS